MTSHEMAKITKRLEEGLKAVWRLRMDQKLSECRVSYQQLLKRLKIEPELFQAEFLSSVDPSQFPIFVEAFLLYVSLLRSDGKIKEARDSMDLLEKILKKRNVACSFQFFFQKGNNFLYTGDSTSALEFFVQASEQAGTNEEKVLSLSNTLYCLENLGQSFEAIFSELKRRLAEIPPGELSGVRVQFSALERRHDFRSGNFSAIFSERVGEVEGQEAHLRFWCSELPYHSRYKCLTEREREAYFTKIPNLFQRSYRMRTLQGVIHASDLEKRFRESDFADRLYLWTWRWAVSPEAFSFEKVLILLENIELQEVLQRSTAEDFCLIRNALLWIAFFVPRYSVDLERMAGVIKQPGTGVYPLFDFEKQIIDYLRARQQKSMGSSQILKKLKIHPLWKSEIVRLRSLVECSQSDSFPPLRDITRRISELLDQADRYQKGVIYVDMGRCEAIWDGGRQRVISDSICLALDLMRRKECLSFEEFLSACFGIQRFDSIVHNAKVYNLLARIKEIVGAKISIKTKNGRIYCYGPWEEIEIIYPAAGLEDLFRRTDLARVFKRVLPSSPPTPTRTLRPFVVVASKKDPSVLSRQELELAIGKSRATANRIIQNWVEEGIVKKIGQARNTKYLVLTDSRKLPIEI